MYIIYLYKKQQSASNLQTFTTFESFKGVQDEEEDKAEECNNEGEQYHDKNPNYSHASISHVDELRSETNCNLVQARTQR